MVHQCSDTVREVSPVFSFNQWQMPLSSCRELLHKPRCVVPIYATISTRTCKANVHAHAVIIAVRTQR